MKTKIFSILFALLLVAGLSLMTAVPAAAYIGNTYYVSTTGDNGNDGLSWATALRDIQFAIDKPFPYTIYVAAGTYYENITLTNGVRVLGAGADVTTIDGSNSGRVVTANSVGSGTKLDGFTITNGNQYGGGGMYNNGSSPTVSNCTFYENHADAYGGGMYNSDSSPTVTNCTFSSNSAADPIVFYGFGGGMYDYNSSPVVTNCTFYDNDAECTGGGMYNDYHSSPIVTNCTFYDNTAVASGGGMYNQNSSSPAVTNCTFSGNSASNGGGMFSFNSSPSITNNIIVSNTASTGGGIYAGGTPLPIIDYNDVWNNTPNNYVGCSAGAHDISQDPLFVGAGDFHLQGTSPCIDVGSDAAPSLPSTDFEGDPRKVDGDGNGLAMVDMGADEYAQTEVWVDDGFNSGTPGWGYDHFDKINDGVAAVANGGTVHVYAGIYNEPPTVINKSLTLESVSGNWHGTTIDNLINAEIVITDPTGPFTGNATISGFTITGGTQGINIDGLAASGTVTVDNCLIYDNGAGIYGMGTIDGDIFINNCIISKNGAPATGISLDYVAGTVSITDSFIGAYWDGITSYSGNSGDGIEIDIISETGNVLIDNNKIVNNTGNGIEDGIMGGCYGQLTITNNIIGAYDYDLTSGAGYFGGNSGYGISIDYVGPDGVVNIDGNRIADNYWGIEFGSGFPIEGDVIIDNNYIGAWTDYTTVDEVLYTQTYSGNDSVGIYVLTVAKDGSLIIINNKVAENSYGIPDDTGIHIASTNGDTIISANYVGSWTQDIPGGNPVTHQGNGGPGILVNYVNNGSLLIHGNTIADNIELLSGIHIQSAVDTADVSVNLNDILNNGGDGVYYLYGGVGYLEYIDATNNWWGDTSGPGGEGPGTGDEVSTNVDYEPWLRVSVENALAGAITDDGTLDNVDGADTEVIVDGSATVTTARYSGNPGSGFSGDIGKYIDVHIDDPTGVDEIEIRVYYTDAEIAGLDEPTLRLHWWNGTSWVDCSDSGVTYPAGGHAYRGYMWAKIRSDTTPNLTQLSGTAFGGQGAIAVRRGLGEGADTTSPTISNVLLCSEGITETTADICWTTNEEGTSQVEYEASPGKLSPLDTRYVTEHHVHLTGLTPCTTYSYRTMSKDRAGNLAVSGVYTFTTLGEAAFTSNDLSISPGEVSAGDTVNIGVVVTNTGSCSDSYTVTLKINDVVEATKDVTVNAGASKEVAFTTAKDEAGNYSVDVNGLSGSFTVKAEATPTAEEEAASPTVNWPVVGGIIGGVVVVGLIIFFLVRRRAH
jgi:parallel beta-helix repeat protein